jgi:23S rRNA (uracil1939-C5)-methyltransferase
MNTLKRQLYKFSTDKLMCNYFEAPHRTGYRNRIQLHYDQKAKLLGFQNSEHEIVEVPNCIIGLPEIKIELERLYQNNFWTTLLKGQPTRGHIEIYSKDNSIHTKINGNYADGGFTQVNSDMNSILNDYVTTKSKDYLRPNDIVLDLFGGNGNLSKNLTNRSSIVDKYNQVPLATNLQSFISLDLYEKTALQTLKKSCKHADWIIIDPPRSGLNNLSEFIMAYAPRGFIYVSCQSTSFTRDTLPLLSLYELTNIQLFDLFPSTHHFETVGIFTRRNLTL